MVFTYSTLGFCNGKYTYIRDEKGQRVLRYGVEWRDITGDSFIMAMAHKIEELVVENQELRNRLDDLNSDAAERDLIP